MPEVSKYEILLNELQTLEAQVLKFRAGYYENTEKVKALEEMLLTTKKENESLLEKIALYEEQNQSFDFGHEEKILSSLDIREKEELKVKLQFMIGKIENYLSS
ncbi:MAG: hypothetical protein Q8903_01060 [Bacteroidota bacterium]|nr:hypothetical protein [Bacteroidota bacterium]